MNDVPAILYKYLPPERASSVVGNLLLRFSQASVMNDIEEFKPPNIGVATEEVFQQEFRERANALYPGLIDLVEKQGPEYMGKLHDQAESNLLHAIKTIPPIRCCSSGDMRPAFPTQRFRGESQWTVQR